MSVVEARRQGHALAIDFSGAGSLEPPPCVMVVAYPCDLAGLDCHEPFQSPVGSREKDLRFTGVCEDKVSCLCSFHATCFLKGHICQFVPL